MIPNSVEVSTSQEEKTIQLAERLAFYLKRGDIVCLDGELGSGKTTFVKGLAKGLGADLRDVNSPTFVLLNIYQGRFPIYHFDLYRLETKDAIRQVGYEEFLYGEGVSVIEWASRLKELWPKDCLQVSLFHQGENKRTIRIQSHSDRYAHIFKRNALEKKKR